MKIPNRLLIFNALQQFKISFEFENDENQLSFSIHRQVKWEGGMK